MGHIFVEYQARPFLYILHWLSIQVCKQHTNLQLSVTGSLQALLLLSLLTF